jgi:hydrogenase maturation factor
MKKRKKREGANALSLVEKKQITKQKQSKMNREQLYKHYRAALLDNRRDGMALAMISDEITADTMLGAYQKIALMAIAGAFMDVYINQIKQVEDEAVS